MQNAELCITDRRGFSRTILVNMDTVTLSGRRYILSAVQDITDRCRAEEEKRKNIRLESLVRIMLRGFDSVQDFLDYALDEAIEMTGSRHGYIYFYNEDLREFILNTWSKNVMTACSVAEKQTKYLLEKTGYWGEVVRQRRPLINNEFSSPHPMKKGYPQGHTPIERFLSVPVFSGEAIVAVVGMANKGEDYTAADLDQLSLLMESVWKAVEFRRSGLAKFQLAMMDAALIRGLPGFVYRCANDRNWTMEYMSDGCRDITGYDALDFIGNRVVAYNDIVQPEYRDPLWNQWQKAIDGRKHFEGEYPIVTASGDIRWVREWGEGSSRITGNSSTWRDSSPIYRQGGIEGVDENTPLFLSFYLTLQLQNSQLPFRGPDSEFP